MRKNKNVQVLYNTDVSNKAADKSEKQSTPTVATVFFRDYKPIARFKKTRTGQIGRQMTSTFICGSNKLSAQRPTFHNLEKSSKGWKNNVAWTYSSN